MCVCVCVCVRACVCVCVCARARACIYAFTHLLPNLGLISYKRCAHNVVEHLLVL
jgi:GTPase involved in cell partitioning and DNA repair